MKTNQIEAWAFRVLERVKLGQPLEDISVELKAEWMNEPNKAARRIAGHANTMHGQDILWLIGVDEKRGVIGAEPNDLASWWPRVQAEFNEVTPSLNEVIIPVDNMSVVALQFDTERAPFVVKNPEAGKPGGGPVEMDVPWREGTRSRSARRSELMRLLATYEPLPQIDFIAGRCIHSRIDHGTLHEQKFWWRLDLALYIIPRPSTTVVIPYHLCKATMAVGERTNTLGVEKIISTNHMESEDYNVPSTECLTSSPGMFILTAVLVEKYGLSILDQPCTVNIDLYMANSDAFVPVQITLPHVSSQAGELGRWSLSKDLNGRYLTIDEFEQSDDL